MGAVSEGPVESHVGEKAPQLTEVESSLIYDEMLRSGRIIQVTSDGVCVFDRDGVFIREEVLKAKFVFPRIDATTGLERMLDRNMEKDEYKVEKVGGEIYRSVYKPVKRTLDRLAVDSRNFFAESAGLDQVRTDLDNVIERMDLLTLGMLNDILTQSELEFRRHIEAGVYCGLAGSVIFGDHKCKLSDRKVVEDLILLGIVHGLGPGLEQSKSFQELCRTSKSFCDVRKVLEEVHTTPDEPTNILSEILATSLSYIKALDQDEERDTLNALVTLQGSGREAHAIAIGALVHKYAIGDYMLGYLLRDEEFRRRLSESEDRFQASLRARTEKERIPATRKLGEMFLQGLRFKRTIKLGSDAMHDLDEFVGTLLPVKSAASDFLERAAGDEGGELARLKGVTETAVEAVEACLQLLERHADPGNWFGLERLSGAAYLLAHRMRSEIGYNVQRAIRAVERCRDRATELAGSAEAEAFREALAEFDRQMAATDRFGAPMEHQPFDITRALRSVGRVVKKERDSGCTVGVPEGPVMVVIDPIGVEDLVQKVLETIAGEGCLSIVAGVTEDRCFIEIRDSSDRPPTDLPGLGEELEAAAPGARFSVTTDKGPGATFLLEFPLAEPAETAGA